MKYLFAKRKFECGGVRFNSGEPDVMKRGAGLTGAADSKVGLVSFWIKSFADGAADQHFFASTGLSVKWYLLATSRECKFICENVGGSAILSIETSSQILVADGWNHIAASWNLATSTVHIYRNGISDKVENTVTNDTIDYTVADWSQGDNMAGVGALNAEIAEFIFANEYLDLSDVGNMSKLKRGNSPADPGDDGSKITGSQPLCYFSIRPEDAATAWLTNRGSGGNFSMTSGALGLATSSPRY